MIISRRFWRYRASDLPHAEATTAEGKLKSRATTAQNGLPKKNCRQKDLPV